MASGLPPLSSSLSVAAPAVSSSAAAAVSSSAAAAAPAVVSSSSSSSSAPTSSSASASFSAATGKINYIRLSTLLIDVGRRALRDIFDTIHPPSTLNGVLCSKSVKEKLLRLKSGRKLFTQQWDILYPRSGVSASSANFDVTLLVLLLRTKKICYHRIKPPVTGWNGQPSPLDKSSGADLVRIKLCRNELAHPIDLALSDTEFETKWNEIKEVLIRLGGSKYEAEIERLKVDSIDAECINALKVLLQSCEEGQENILDAMGRQEQTFSDLLQSQTKGQENILDAMGRQEQTSSDLLQSQDEGQEKILDAMGRQEQTSRDISQSQTKGQEKILDAMGRQEQTSSDLLQSQTKGQEKILDAMGRQEQTSSELLQSQKKEQEKILNAMGRQEQTSSELLQSQKKGQEKILDAMGRQEQTSSALLQSQKKGQEKILDVVGRTEQKVDSWEIKVKVFVKVAIGGVTFSWAEGSACFLQRYSDDPEMVIPLVQEAIIPAREQKLAGAVVAAIVPGSFEINIHVSSLEALDQLWESYINEEMKRRLETIIVTDDLKALAPDGVEKIFISLSISKDDYETTRRSLMTANWKTSMKRMEIPWSHTMEWSKAISSGKSKQEKGQNEEAIIYFNKALVIARSNGSKEEEAKTLGLLADLYNSIEKYREAVGYYEKGLPIAQEIGDKELEWRMCKGLGDAYSKLGQCNVGIKYMKQGLDIALTTGDSQLIANSYNNLGSAYDSLYEYQNSLKYYNEAIDMYTQLVDEKGLGSCYLSLSMSYLNQGKYRDAIHFQEESLKIRDKIGDEEGKVTSLLNMGNIHQTLNDLKKAVDYYQQSLTIAKEISHKRLQGKCCRNLGSVLMKSGKYQDAISHHSESLAIAEQLGDKQGQARTNLNIGNCYINMNLYSEAHLCLNNCLIIANEINEKQLQALVYYNMADFNFEIGKFQQAISMSKKCLDIAVSINDKECEGNACYLLGKAYHSLAKENQEQETHVNYMDKSEQQLKRALECYDYLFSQLQHREQLQISIFDKFMNTYKLLTTVYIETQQPQQALLVSDRERARALVDRLIFKNGTSQEECLSSEPLTYPDVENVLSNDAFTLVHYSLLDQSLAVWVLSKGSIEFKKTDKQQFVSAVESIQQLQYGMPLSLDGTSVNEPGQKSHPLEVLFNALIAPVLSYVKHDEVVIVPDGKMYTVPFAALKDPNTGQYLSETKRIRLAPSITILKVLQECPVGHHSQQGALIVGNPTVGKVMFNGKEATLGNLPGAEMEARCITNLLSQASRRTANPNITTLTGKQATKDVVLTKLKEGAAIIHIAASGSSEYGEILLAPNVSTDSSGLPEEQDYLLTMTEVQQVAIKAQLVVLSYCHSGRGEIRAEGMVGLGRAFLAAGARAVVASLWAIEDKATPKFMVSFYSRLKKGESASVSLRGAMKDMRKRHSNPKDWAPFFLIGDDVTIKF